MNLIGIAGTNGSGKDTLGQMLADKYGYLFISVTDILRDELTSRGLPLSRKYMRELSAEWRRESGLGVLVDKARLIFTQNTKDYRGLAIASLRNPGEVDRVHEFGGKVVWLDATPEIRFERVQTNRASRGAHRSIDDNMTFERFLYDEEIEMQPTGDDTQLHGAAVKSKADIFIENNSEDVESFGEKVKASLDL